MVMVCKTKLPWRRFNLASSIRRAGFNFHFQRFHGHILKTPPFFKRWRAGKATELVKAGAGVGGDLLLSGDWSGDWSRATSLRHAQVELLDPPMLLPAASCMGSVWSREEEGRKTKRQRWDKDDDEVLFVAMGVGSFSSAAVDPSM